MDKRREGEDRKGRQQGKRSRGRRGTGGVWGGKEGKGRENMAPRPFLKVGAYVAGYTLNAKLCHRMIL